MIELWRGTANAWECDHLGHMNTRFYVARMEQALASLFAEHDLGAPIALHAQHIRFHREVRAGTPMHATGSITGCGKEAADALILLHHSRDGELAATFRLTVFCDKTISSSHLSPEIPSAAQFRGLRDGEGADPRACLDTARAIGMRRTGRTLITDDDCDQAGQWRPAGAMGLLADSVAHLNHDDWRETLSRTSPTHPARIGGALVEFVFHHRSWPQSGDRVDVWSALAGCTDRVTRAAHWLIDPCSGRAWATARTVGIALDLDSRRPISLTREARAVYAHATPSEFVGIADDEVMVAGRR